MLQYVIVKPLMTALAIYLDENDLLDEAEYRLDRGYLYITIVNTISVTVSAEIFLLSPSKKIGNFLAQVGVFA